MQRSEPNPITHAGTELEQMYAQMIRMHLFGEMDMRKPDGSGYYHVYNKNIMEEMGESHDRRQRLQEEIKFIAQNLPVHFASSIGIRFDSTRNHVIKAVILAPPNTPYDSGVFTFDIYLPPRYPMVPPKMSITSTAGGTVRFSPNLYKNGKVCLSLLGTWRGDNTSQEWNPQHSTLWQVLVSVQSAILGSQFPVYDEPGVTDRCPQFVRHCTNGGFEPLRLYTIKYAMSAMIHNPPPGFIELVMQHFNVKAEYVINIVKQWVQDASEQNKKHYIEAYQQLEMDLNILRFKLQKH